MFGFRFVVLRENAHTASRVLSEPCTKGKYNPFCKPGFYVLNATPAKHCKNRRTPAGLFLQAAYHQAMYFSHTAGTNMGQSIQQKFTDCSFFHRCWCQKQLLLVDKRKFGFIAISPELTMSGLDSKLFLE